METSVVVFIRTSSVARAAVYRHLRSLDLTMVMVHPTELAPDFDNIFQYWVNCDTHDVDALRAVLVTFLHAHGLVPSAIVSFDEYGVYPAALLAESFGLRSVPLPAARVRTTNLKFHFRHFCAAHKINSPAMRMLRRPSFLPRTQLLCSPSSRLTTPRATEGEDAGDGDGLRARLTAYVREAMSTLNFPIVVKPSPGAGSLLARLCHNVDEVVAHALYAWRAFERHPDTKHFNALHTRHLTSLGDDAVVPPDGAMFDAKPMRSSGSSGDEYDGLGVYNAVELLMEEYIGGQEVDMDCVIEHGRLVFCAISDNFATKPPYFAEEGGLCPSALPVAAQVALRELLLSFVHAHGEALHGVLHFEAKYDFDRRQAYVIEVNCRMGSAETNTMLRTAYRDFQLGEALVRCALQLPVRDCLLRCYPEYATLLSSPHSSRHPHDSAGEWSVKNAAIMPVKSHGEGDGKGDAVNESGAVCAALGGPSCGFFPTCAVAASVNIYPERAGVLRAVHVPTEDQSLVAYSVATPGTRVSPPPRGFGLMCWMVARGSSSQEAIANIQRLTRNFTQDVTPDTSPDSTGTAR